MKKKENFAKKQNDTNKIQKNRILTVTSTKRKGVETQNKLEKNEFVQYYHLNNLPCKIQHGSIQNKLSWEQNINLEELNYDPILLKFFQGLSVTKHPYDFICTEAIKQLCVQQGAQQKIKPLLQDIVNSLRQTLQSKDEQSVLNGLQGVRSLSIGSKQDLNLYLKFLVTSLSKQQNNKKLKKHIMMTLEIIEENGGQEALKLIKQKIPTYVSIYQLIIFQKIQRSILSQQFINNI